MKEKEARIDVKAEAEYTEKNHPGRDKCDKLREIRKKIAEANDIPFEPEECHHTGSCSGTCPACDAEVKYLDEEIQKKKQRGEEVLLSGLASDVTVEDEDDEEDEAEIELEVPELPERVLMGIPVVRDCD